MQRGCYAARQRRRDDDRNIAREDTAVPAPWRRVADGGAHAVMSPMPPLYSAGRAFPSALCESTRLYRNVAASARALLFQQHAGVRSIVPRKRKHSVAPRVMRVLASKPRVRATVALASKRAGKRRRSFFHKKSAAEMRTRSGEHAQTEGRERARAAYRSFYVYHHIAPLPYHAASLRASLSPLPHRTGEDGRLFDDAARRWLSYFIFSRRPDATVAALADRVPPREHRCRDRRILRLLAARTPDTLYRRLSPLMRRQSVVPAAPRSARAARHALCVVRQRQRRIEPVFHERSRYLPRRERPSVKCHQFAQTQPTLRPDTRTRAR